MRQLLIPLMFCAGLACAGAVAAEVDERIDKGSLSFAGGQGFTNAVLMIVGPGEFEAEETASRGLPVFRATNSGRLKDGLYQYTLSAATDEKLPIKNKIDNGRGATARDYLLKPFSMSGTFVVKDGTIIPSDKAAAGADRDEEPK